MSLVRKDRICWREKSERKKKQNGKYVNCWEMYYDFNEL